MKLGTIMQMVIDYLLLNFNTATLSRIREIDTGTMVGQPGAFLNNS